MEGPDPKRRRVADATVEEGERRVKSGAARYHCNYCQRDITNLFRIKCAQCTDFDLCLECFSVGVEEYPHKNSHDYRVMDNMTYPIFDVAWGADEELLLLEAIQTCGLGNWVDVQEHVGTKTKQECEDHYFSTYITTPTCPLPDPAKAVDPTKAERRQQVQPKLKQDDPSTPLKGVKNERGSQETRSLQTPHPKAGSKTSSSAPAPNSEVAGYMPLRNDFETEYDNDAEMLIAEMEISPSDTQEDKDLKLKLLQLYHAKLEERGRRKEFVLERGLLDFKKLCSQERRWPKEKRELYHRMRPFARFHTHDEHEQLIEDIFKERELRKRIALLQEYRRHGIRTLAEAEVFKVDKRKHDEEVRRAQEESAHARGSQRLLRYLHRDRTTVTSGGTVGSGISSKGAIRRPLDIEQCAGADMLSPQERKLCSDLRIIPRQYMIIKDVLIKESERAGFVKPSTAAQLLRIDTVKTGKLYEFFVSSGWVHDSPQTSSSATAAQSSAATSAQHQDDHMDTSRV
eukprot:c7392_g1_i1.p1 GENE.c7392_g1_i1~~c7392_g1_i1.p1  ORF type:complete len:514 (+),score=136.17 c7392_g1_i1:57-1598(+)